MRFTFPPLRRCFHVFRHNLRGALQFINHSACQEAYSCYSIGNKNLYANLPWIVALRTIVNYEFSLALYDES